LLKAKDLVIAKRFKRLVSQKIRVCRILVFGSRARGDAALDADLDLLVEIEYPKPGFRKWISECAWEAGFSSEVVVAPVVYTKDELQNHPARFSCFLKTVLKEGIAV